MLNFPDASVSSDEEKIIFYTRELCEQLGVPELNPQKISWSPRSLIAVSYGNVRLPKRMMGHLTPEDWKPLIASSMIYEGLIASARNKKFYDEKQILTRLLPLALVPGLLLVGVIRISFGVNESAYRSLLLLGSLAGYVAFELPMIRRLLSVSTKEIQSMADKEAADIVGAKAVLQVLEKIDKMGLDHISPIERLFRIQYNARQRIEGLRNFPTGSGPEQN